MGLEDKPAHLPFVVERYEFSTLLTHFADDRKKVGRAIESLTARANALYFKDYFTKCNATVIVVENEYVDRDYLNDYAAYYVRCFSEIPKTTKRIHIFRNIKFNHDEFVRALRGDDPTGRSKLDELRNPENYVGFIVVKPLPETFIGRTCLRTYPREVPGEKRDRHYTIKRTYEANLFGISLSVDSIAFQEQDKEVSACATSALWSLFQGCYASIRFEIPSPHAITLAASERIADWQLSNPETRRFPSRGLTIAQMAGAIRDVGLEAYLIGLKSPIEIDTPPRLPKLFGKERKVEPKPKAREVLSPAVYAYLSGGIPIVLTGKLMEDMADGEGPALRGDHAVTILGFGLDWSQRPKPITFKNCETILRGMRIDKLYVHDDQIGPFARMEWKDDDFLATTWYQLQSRTIFAKPHCLFVPLSDRIRIPYETIEQAVIELNELIKMYVVQRNGDQVEWDIRLLTVNRLKREVMEDENLAPAVKEQLLVRHLPKHIWGVTGWLSYGQTYRKHIDFLIDASALEQEGGLRQVIFRDEFLSAAFLEAANTYSPKSAAGFRTLTRKVIEYFRTPFNSI